MTTSSCTNICSAIQSRTEQLVKEIKLKGIKFEFPKKEDAQQPVSDSALQLQNISSLVNTANRDKWSNQGVSSAVSITLKEDSGDVDSVLEEIQDSPKKCVCLRKIWGNIILYGVFGIDNCRYINRRHWMDRISQELLSNTLYFSSRIHGFIKNDLLPEVKSLATQMYFPTGQIEADGLSVISAEVWAATYLLLGTHKNIREGDFHQIRSAYTNLAWDSGRSYRVTKQFFSDLVSFRLKFYRFWMQIEKLAGVPKSDFADIDRPPQSVPKTKQLLCDLLRAAIRIDDESVLQNTLDLYITPEKKSLEEGGEEICFSEMSYGDQIQIVDILLSKPLRTLHQGCRVLSSTGEKMKIELLCKENSVTSFDKDLTFSKASKILIATLTLLFEQVNIPTGLRLDFIEWFRNVNEEMNSFLSYADWIIAKFSEFHGMIALCYNFGMLCFDLDLPKFEDVVNKEENADSVMKLESTCDGDRLALKSVSLTQLMKVAEVNSRKQVVDDDFDWQDFYKTDYHQILQKLPLRVGQNLVQFRAKLDAKLVVQNRLQIVFSEAKMDKEIAKKIKM